MELDWLRKTPTTDLLRRFHVRSLEVIQSLGAVRIPLQHRAFVYGAYAEYLSYKKSGDISYKKCGNKFVRKFPDIRVTNLKTIFK